MSTQNDPVHRPAHYANTNIEVANFIADRGLDYFLGNVVKYVSRAGIKNPDTELEDLEKAQAYLGMKIRLLQGELAIPRVTDQTFNNTKVAPAVPTFLDRGIDVPDVLGVRYLLYTAKTPSMAVKPELSATVALEMKPGDYAIPAGNDVVVVAEPKLGYYFPNEVVRAWRYTSRPLAPNE